jgi:predicted transcriptional regulator
METAKQSAIKIIEQLPDEASYEDIMDRLLFMQKVDAGLEDIRQGRVVTHEEAKKRLAKWLK